MLPIDRAKIQTVITVNNTSSEFDFDLFETQLRVEIEKIGLFGNRIKWDIIRKENIFLLLVSVTGCTRYDFDRLIKNFIQFLDNQYNTRSKADVDWRGKIKIGGQTIKKFHRKVKKEI